MNLIFILYNNDIFINNFKTLNDALKYANSNNNKNYKIYVEEYNNDIDAHMIKTLLYKNEEFVMDNVSDYY